MTIQQRHVSPSRTVELKIAFLTPRSSSLFDVLMVASFILHWIEVQIGTLISLLYFSRAEQLKI